MEGRNPDLCTQEVQGHSVVQSLRLTLFNVEDDPGPGRRGRSPPPPPRGGPGGGGGGGGLAAETWAAAGSIFSLLEEARQLESGKVRRRGDALSFCAWARSGSYQELGRTGNGGCYKVSLMGVQTRGTVV